MLSNFLHLCQKCLCLPVDEETVRLVDYISKDFIIKHHSRSVDYYQEIE
jgi:hypothetical protein